MTRGAGARPDAQAEHRHGGVDTTSRHPANWSFQLWGLSSEGKRATDEYSTHYKRALGEAFVILQQRKQGQTWGFPERAAPGEGSPLVTLLEMEGPWRPCSWRDGTETGLAGNVILG